MISHRQALENFIVSLNEERFYDAHEDLEAIWFPRRFEDDDEIKLLKGFINAAVSFELHKKKFQGYYSGHTIRMSRKKKEVQFLISHSDTYPAVYPLCTIYEKRFNINFKNIIKMAAVYENYPSRNL